MGGEWVPIALAREGRPVAAFSRKKTSSMWHHRRVFLSLLLPLLLSVVTAQRDVSVQPKNFAINVSMTQNYYTDFLEGPILVCMYQMEDNV